MADLVSHGYDVTNVDIAASREPGAPTLIADLTDLGQTIDSLRGADAVVHLAAIPAPFVLPDGETFRVNMMSTYNVFSAAAQLGMEKVVWASSETLIGLPFEREQPRYAPIDEEHPRLPEFHYALSKLAGEVIGEQFSRWTGIPYVALRYSNVMEENDYQGFPGFWEDPKSRAWNLLGLRRRPGRCPMHPTGPRERCVRRRSFPSGCGRHLHDPDERRTHGRVLS